MRLSGEDLWSETRYDRKFWVWAYGALAAFAVVAALLADSGGRVLLWFCVAALTGCTLYKAWKWSRDGRWISKPPARPSQ